MAKRPKPPPQPMEQSDTDALEDALIAEIIMDEIRETFPDFPDFPKPDPNEPDDPEEIPF